jgi:hypothetical protein
MRHSRLGLAVGVSVALAPAVAQANSGIGLFMPAAMANVVALIPVVILEGLILWRLLRVTAKRGFYLSLIANLASTLVGFAIGVPFDVMMGGGGPPDSGLGVSISLFVMFWLSWWIEAKVVRRMQKADPATRAGRATFFANVASYAVLIALALIFIPGDPWPLRTRLTEVLNTLRVAQDGLAEHYLMHGGFPEDFKPGLSKAVRSIRLASDGRLNATVDMPKYPEAHGKEIIVTPRIVDGKIAAWTCHSIDIDRRYMPRGCQDPPPPGVPATKP